MREEYDFSKAVKNPYMKKGTKQITIDLDEPTEDYFRKMAADSGIPYQKLISLYLAECARDRKVLPVTGS